MDKRTVLAFVLISLVILYMSTDHYKRLAGIPEVDSSAVSLDMADADNHTPPVPQKDLALETMPSPAEIIAEEVPEDLTTDEQSYTLPFSASPRAESRVRVETEQFVATFNTRGASLERFELKGFKSYYGDHVLLLNNGQGNLNPGFNLDGLLVDGSLLDYELTMGSDMSLRDGEKGELVFRFEDAAGRYIEKVYAFTGGVYGVDLDLAVGGLKERLRNAGYQLGWNTGLMVTELDTLQDATYSEIVVQMGSEIENFSSGMKDEIKSEGLTGTVNWVTLRNKYFGVAVVPRSHQGNSINMEGQTRHFNGSKKPLKSFSWSMELPLESSSEIRDHFSIFLGPLHSDYLAGVEPDLEKAAMTRTSLGAMGFMWPVIRPFAGVIRWVFNFLHGFIPNYGIVIIIFSLLVKIVVFPLTHKSYKSMKEMQRIKPLLDDVKTRFKSNPKKMQEETMKLYKEHKVNPLGSCMPMLLQMPLFFALFFVFRSTFDLRGAYFVGWITDLSVPDVIFHLPFTLPMYGNTVGLLPILMAISSYFMSRMTSSSAEPMQQNMMKIMPVMMLVLFNNFPSGLTLYYTLFNLLSALQQHYSKGMIESGPITVPVQPVQMVKKKKGRK